MCGWPVLCGKITYRHLVSASLSTEMSFSAIFVFFVPFRTLNFSSLCDIHVLYIYRGILTCSLFISDVFWCHLHVLLWSLWKYVVTLSLYLCEYISMYLCDVILVYLLGAVLTMSLRSLCRSRWSKQEHKLLLWDSIIHLHPQIIIWWLGHLTRNETRYHNKDKKDENYE